MAHQERRAPIRLAHPLAAFRLFGPFRETGWQIICDEPNRGNDVDLDRVPLAPEFRRYSKQDLLVLTAFVAA